jgi:gliding motility-associated-like protein
MNWSLRLILFCFVFSTIKASAANLVVTSLADSGPGTLRDQVAAAASGDRIEIRVAGIIQLSSQININKSLEIIGAFPIHTKINVDGLPANNYALLLSAPNIYLSGFGFVNTSAVSDRGAVQVNATGSVKIRDCVFEKTAAFGGAVFAQSGTIEIMNCSFIDNIGSADGGGIRMVSPSRVRLINCTFSGNEAGFGSNGGAVCDSGADFVEIIHCTFSNNTAPNSGDDISIAGGDTLVLQNNLFATVSLNSIVNSSGQVVSNGGNLHGALSPGFTTIGTDIFNFPVSSVFIGALKTDGFGLKYLPLNTGSNAINAAVPTSLSTDCRRAPRSMPNNLSIVGPDAGAYEYTPYRVSNGNMTGVNSLSDVISSVNAATAGPFFIEFNAATPPTLSATAALPNINKTVTIDGFSQTGSAIMGPGTTANTLTPMVPGFTLDGQNTVLTGFQINAAGSASKIHGLTILHYSAQGIVLSGTTNVVITGNKLAGCNMGIEVQFANNNVVGDSGYYKMNIISSNTSRGILFNGAFNNFVRHNLIGTNDNGTAAAAIVQNVGIEIVAAASVDNLIGGMYTEEEGNIISGNSVHQILITGSSTSNALKGNLIGLAYDGTTPILSAFAYGVSSTVSAGSNLIGGPQAAERNIIVGQGNGGILLDNSGSNTILNNYIGFFTDVAPTAVPNHTGIFIQNASTNNTIGSNAVHNYISGNTNQGVLIDNSSQNSLTNNFIGLSNLGTSLGNGAAGVLLSNNANNNLIGTAGGGNYVSGNNGHGIAVSNSPNNFIINNKIGTDTTVTSPNSNSLNGIDVFNSLYLQINGNFINGSGQNGISLSSDSCQIFNNKIGTDLSNLIQMGNSQHGIFINGNLNQIGTGTVNGNTIAYNGNFGSGVGAGVAVISGLYNGILGNSIFKNAGLGIDIEADGVTPNDPADADGGTNNGQNFVDSIYISNCGGVTNIRIVYEADLSQDYVLELYQNPSGSGNGDTHGEGKIFYGTFNLFPSVTGTNVFTTTSATLLSTTDTITATLSRTVAAGGYYETSEFSPRFVYQNGISSSTVSSANISCNGLTDGWISVDALNGVAPFTYEWFNSASTNIGQTTDSVTNLAADTYTCTITDATGCQHIASSVTLTEPPVLTSGVTFSDPTCNGECTGSINITAGGGTTPYTYTQDGTTFLTSNIFSNLCAGTYNTLGIKDANGCIQNLAAITLVDPTPLIITATPTAEICAGACDGAITATNTGGIGLIEFDLTGSGTFLTSSTLTNVCAGTYFAIVRDGNLCKDSMQVIVNPGYVLNANAGADQTICPGGSANLTGNVTTGTATSYTWYLVGNAAVIASTQNTSVSPTVTTSYVVEILGGPSCVDKDTVTVTIGTSEDPNIVYPLATLDTVLACQTGTNLIPNITTPGGTFSVSPATGLSLSGSTGEITFTSSTIGTYTVYYTTAGCQEVDSVAVFVLPTPSAPTPVTPTSFTICGGTPIPTMGIDQSLTAGAILWATDASLTNIGWIGYNYTPGSVASGLNDYFVFERYNNCQSPSVEFDIYNIDNSLLNDGSPYSTCPDIPVTISVTASTGTISSFLWSPGSAVADSASATTTITPSVTTTLTYSLDVLGCPLSGSVTIDVSTDPNCAFENIYTAFSPEGDGVNDTWIIEGVINNPNNKVYIYNRWGDLLQEFENYDNVNVVWDGTYKGALLPSGTYYYVIVYTELDRQYSGWVQLTR